MVVHLDESYDYDRTYMVLGALFCPHHRALHRGILAAKRAAGLVAVGGCVRETKYYHVTNARALGVAKNIVDAFMESAAWFRAVAIEEATLDLDRFGSPSEPRRIKRARAYKKFAELLIAHNTHDLTNGVLLTDRMTRCRGDEFVERMKDAFCRAGYGWSAGKVPSRFRHIEEVASHLQENQCLQLCDLLTGCVINRLVPIKNTYKNEIAEYVFRRVGIHDVPMPHWWHVSKAACERKYAKFYLWGWRPSKK